MSGAIQYGYDAICLGGNFVEFYLVGDSLSSFKLTSNSGCLGTILLIANDNAIMLFPDAESLEDYFGVDYPLCLHLAKMARVKLRVKVQFVGQQVFLAYKSNNPEYLRTQIKSLEYRNNLVFSNLPVNPEDTMWMLKARTPCTEPSYASSSNQLFQFCQNRHKVGEGTKCQCSNFVVPPKVITLNQKQAAQFSCAHIRKICESKCVAVFKPICIREAIRFRHNVRRGNIQTLWSQQDGRWFVTVKCTLDYDQLVWASVNRVKPSGEETKLDFRCLLDQKENAPQRDAPSSYFLPLCNVQGVPCISTTLEYDPSSSSLPAVIHIDAVVAFWPQFMTLTRQQSIPSQRKYPDVHTQQDTLHTMWTES